MSETGEPRIDGAVEEMQGLAMGWLYQTPRFGILRWDCAHERRELSGEKWSLWHAIGFIHSGAFVMHEGGRSEVIDATSVLLSNPGVPFRSEHPFGCCDHGSVLVVRREVLLEVMARHDPTAAERPQALFPAAHAHGFSRAYYRQRQLIQGIRRGLPADPWSLEEEVSAILDEVAAGCARLKGRAARSPGASKRARRCYVEDAKAFLQERFREPLRLEDVAVALYVSPFHLCRLFSQETGETMHCYLNRLRLREALEPLAGRASLSDLALSLGFSSHSHFTSAFRKEFGVTPSDARALVGREAAARGGVGG